VQQERPIGAQDLARMSDDDLLRILGGAIGAGAPDDLTVESDPDADLYEGHGEIDPFVPTPESEPE
jgi:hypothetical protein